MIARILCRKCGTMADELYEGQEYHPMCDPDPQTITAEEIAHWAAQGRERRQRDAARTAAGRPAGSAAT